MKKKLKCNISISILKKEKDSVEKKWNDVHTALYENDSSIGTDANYNFLRRERDRLSDTLTDLKKSIIVLQRNG